MRALLEFRLSERWVPLLLSASAALLLASALIAFGFSDFEAPSRPLLLASLFLLVAVWWDARRTEVLDRGEKREALHATLPTTRLNLGLARAAEPYFPVAGAMLVTAAAFFALGRSDVLSAGPWRDDLLLALGVAAWLMALESMQLAVFEVQMVLRRWGLGWVFWIAVVLLFGGPGLLLGMVIGDGSLVPFFFYFALGQPGSIALALVLALLLGLLSVLMYRNRDAMLGTC